MLALSRLVTVAIMLAVALAAFPIPFAKQSSTSESISAFDSRTDQNSQRLTRAFYTLPISFERNSGQADRRVKFLSRGNNYNLFLFSNEALLTMQDADRRVSTKTSQMALRLKFLGANDAPQIEAIDELPGKSNYFIGNDSSEWLTNVPNYAKVKYKELYPGIDVIFYGNHQQLEYDFILAPGASFKAIRLAFDGAERIRIDSEGDIIIETLSGEICQRKPAIYQQIGGSRKKIAGRYVMNENREVGFEVGAYDASAPLVIDPVLAYSTYLGGNGIDFGESITVDSAGNAYLVGITASLDFPTTPGAFQPSGLIATFITKLNAAGTVLIYSTYLGGAPGTGGSTPGHIFASGLRHGIAIDASGNVYVAGATRSSTFPVTPDAVQTTHPCTIGFCIDAFVTKLDATGSTLIYSTYLGGERDDFAYGIAVDRAGNAYVTGETNSDDFPTANALQPAISKGFCTFGDVAVASTDAFVTKLNASGTALIYSTYFGGPDSDAGHSITVDFSGQAYVAGTAGDNLPTTAGTFQPSFGGKVSSSCAGDGFVAKFNDTGQTLIYSTYLGGSNDDEASGLAIDSAGNAYVTGKTGSTNFPVTKDAFQPLNGGSVLFKSTDGGGTWDRMQEGLGGTNINHLAIDPKNSSTLYAGTSVGVFKSTDGGSIWKGLATLSVTVLAIDPQNSSIVYAGTFGGVFKSTDGGSTWNAVNNGLGVTRINALAINPKNPSTIYAGTGISFIPGGSFGSVFKSTNGGSTWKAINKGIPTVMFSELPASVTALAIDPKKPSTIYAATTGGIVKTTNAGKKWRCSRCEFIAFGTSGGKALIIDPSDRSILYHAQGSVISKSIDRGVSWSDFRIAPFDTSVGATADVIALAVNPQDSRTLYAGVRKNPFIISGSFTSNNFIGGVFKSINGGQGWNVTDLSNITVNFLILDPQTPTTLYAASVVGSDAFVAKLDATGAALVYSTYVGGRSNDSGSSIAVDKDGNAHVTGETLSFNFPTLDAFQPQKSQDAFFNDAFVLKLNIAGDLLYSTYFGGIGNDVGRGIVLDAAGDAYIIGTTSSANLPIAGGTQSVFRGGSADAFVIKITAR